MKVGKKGCLKPVINVIEDSEEEKSSEEVLVESTAIVLHEESGVEAYKSDDRLSSLDFPKDDDVVVPEIQALVEVGEDRALSVPFLRAIGRKIGVSNREMANVRVKRVINEAVLGIEAEGGSFEEDEEYGRECEEERRFIEGGGGSMSWADRMDEGERFTSFDDEDDDLLDEEFE